MQPSPWPNPEQAAAWKALLVAQRTLFAQLDRELRRDAGIPHDYYSMLAHLSADPDWTLRMTDLAEWTASSMSRLSYAIGALERLGWVSRQSCETDKRIVNVVLTQAGYDTLAAATPHHVQLIQHALFDQLSPEQVVQLREICEVVVRQLAPAFSARLRADLDRTPAIG